jgi:hypothetical protein
MHNLSNSDLSVFILDPVEDRKRLGSRYCTGGYIWQVSDSQKGELLSGPLFPDEPNTFDGQGMPDMFHQALIPENLPVGAEAACIGVGLVRRTSPQEPFDVRHNPEVTEFVEWETLTSPNTVQMRTDHSFEKWAYHLERKVTLVNRTVLSITEIRNQGSVPLPVRWFAHPFFPNTEDNILCQFSIPVSMTDNPGYWLNDQGFVTRKPDHNWQHGWYQVMDYQANGTELTVVQKHPKVGDVTVVTNFMPAFLPIWGNANTFSFEPYFIRELAPGEGAAWSIEYRF